jgi:hypothetical protein
MNSLSKLSIAAECRRGEKSPDGTGSTERHFWDFLIDGRSLRSFWQDSEGTVSEFVGVLGWGGTKSEVDVVAKLQGEAQPDYPPDRVAIYVCPECGDLGCGAVTVAVKREAGEITWSDFRWEVNWYADRPDESTICFDLGPFRFASDIYTDVLNRALQLRPETG